MATLMRGDNARGLKWSHLFCGELPSKFGQHRPKLLGAVLVRTKTTEGTVVGALRNKSVFKCPWAFLGALCVAMFHGMGVGAPNLLDNAWMDYFWLFD